jgi:Cu-processing system permease protein
MSVIWSIAKNTYKEIIRDKVLYGILVIGLLVTASSFFLSSISFDQTARVIQDIGLAAIHLFALVICVFVATNSLHHDEERRALYLIFSKPISRGQYLLGKFLGFTLLLVTTLAILGGFFLLGAFSTERDIVLGALMNLGYSFLEISLLTAIAVLFATFTAPLNASLYTIALFIIGHSLGLMRTFAQNLGNPLVHGIVNICYYLLPNLDKFDVRRAILYGIHIPPVQVFWSLVYWAFYGGIVLFLAIRVLRNREV